MDNQNTLTKSTDTNDFDLFGMVNAHAEQVRQDRATRDMMAMVNANAERVRASRKLQERKQSKQKAIFNMLGWLCCGVALLFVVWLALSWFNVATNNTSTPELIWDWNFFKVFF